MYHHVNMKYICRINPFAYHSVLKTISRQNRISGVGRNQLVFVFADSEKELHQKVSGKLAMRNHPFQQLGGGLVLMPGAPHWRLLA